MGSPIRLSLIRRHTLMGGDRLVVGLTILFAVMVGWVLTNGIGWKTGVSVGAVIWISGVWLGRALYKADPYALAVWFRHHQLRRTMGNYFAGGGSDGVEPPAIKDFTEGL